MRKYTDKTCQKKNNEAQGPGEIYQLNTFLADVYVFNDSRTEIMGRPVIHLVTDIYSRSIVGLHIELSSPSWNGIKAALSNAFRKKVDYCAEYGIEITQDDWPWHHICREVITDMRNFNNNYTKACLDSIGVDIKSAIGPHGGYLKGLIEKKFKILHTPGSHEKITQCSNEEDPSIGAILTTRDLTK